MARPTVARTDLDALTHNLGIIRRLVGERKLCPAVKADAYSHGALAVAHALSRAGADMFAVAMTEEAVDLRQAGIAEPVLILSAVPAEDIGPILEHGVTGCVTEEGFARELSAQALKRNAAAPVHINVDTGMHRVGLDWEAAVEPVLRIADLPGLEVTGIFSHFACADQEDLSFSHEQIRRFRLVLDQLRRKGWQAPLVHMANSTGILRLPESYFDAVRPGVVLYGLSLWTEQCRRLGLKSVLSLRTRVNHLKRVPKGAKVSYDHTFVAQRDSLIATLPIGYHDGFLREFSNTGVVLVRGRRAPVAGRVCMDQTMVDVTDIPAVSLGDEVVIIGRQGQESLSMTDVARLAGSVPEAFATQLNRRIRREYVYGGKVVEDVPPRSLVGRGALERIFS